MDQSKKSLITPRVKVFFSTKSRAHLMPEVIDLSRPQCAEKNARREAAETWRLGNLDELWSNIALPGDEQIKSK